VQETEFSRYFKQKGIQYMELSSYIICGRAGRGRPSIHHIKAHHWDQDAITITGEQTPELKSVVAIHYLLQP
jgi:hypothetical protein